MITSTVDHNLELSVTLSVADAANQERPIVFMIDTGFNRQLALPASIVSALGMPFVQWVETAVADGSSVWVGQHRAVIVWDGQIRIVEVLAMGGLALVGRGLLAGHTLFTRFEVGGEIRIEKIP